MRTAKLLPLKRTLKIGLVYLSTLWITCGCGGTKSESSSQNVLRINLSSGVSSLDPAQARDQNAIWAIANIYSGLLRMDNSLKPLPEIASKMDILDSGRVYRFHLRSDVFFQKDACFGKDSTRKVVASDFVYSFNRLVNPETASSGAWIFNDKIDTTQHPFRALDDSTFEIRLTNPFPPLPGLLTMQYCSVVPHEAVERYGKDFSSHPVGTGPFKLFLWEPGEVLILHKNDRYFGKDEKGNPLPYLDAVKITFIPDKQAEFMAFLAGELDLISGLDVTFKDKVLNRDGSLKSSYSSKYTLYTKPYLNTEYLGIYLDQDSGKLEKPLQNRLVRQAIACGFDRNLMLRYLRNSCGTPGCGGFIPPGLPGFDSSLQKINQYNPEKAKKLLSWAGYPDGKGLGVIHLKTNPNYLDLCVFMQDQLAKIGVKIEVEALPPTQLRKLMKAGDAGFFRGSWIADYPDAENYLSLFYSKKFAPNGPNYTHYKNAEFDRLYELAGREPELRRRQVAYKSMDRILLEDVPMIVLYYDQSFRLMNKSLKGAEPNPINLLDLRSMHFERD